MEDSYLTIAKPASIEIKEKGSRFIGEAVLVESVESAQANLQRIRKREHAATHHCYAYIVRSQMGSQFKYSDDGEPNGTAGKPIHDVIEGKDLVNTLCVVTRYYGGTKLGTGGLVRAYGAAARSAIEKSGVIECLIKVTFRLEIAFPLYDQAQRLLSQLGATIVQSDFSETVKLSVEIRKSKADQFVKKLTELSAGKARIELARDTT